MQNAGIFRDGSEFLVTRGRPAQCNMKRQNEPHPLSWSQRILYGLTNWALFAAGLANLGVGTWAAFNDSAAVAATSLAAGLVLLFAATIDRFESLKGLGIEAKTKQLDQKLVQADDALRRLREMTEITGAALIDINSKMGRWDSAPGPRESIALANRVRQIMKNLGSDENAIATALRPWAKMLCCDMARAKTTKLKKLLQVRVQELESEQRKIPQPMQPDDPVLSRLTAQIRLATEFQGSRLKNLHRLELEEYPDKFMELFVDVPLIEASEVESLRVAAAVFAPGMLSLRQTRTLPDPEQWIEELQKADAE